MSNLPAIKASVWVDRFGIIVHSMPSIRSPGLPVVRVPDQPDVLVRLVFGEFEGLGCCGATEETSEPL